MAEAIGPAMSRAEWEQKQAVRDGMGISVDAEDDSILCADGRGQEASVMASGRHALAALALHGQPFGFTREDVALLEAVAQREEEEYGPDEGDPSYPTVLRSLAARIAALLPEEEGT